jgi:TetR/AcrR family transcriptional regulator
MDIQEQDEGKAARIREAAKELFLDKGYDGTTMQAIADASSVNKALLHYYYESKDRLFLLIFREELAELSLSLATIWQEGEKTLLERLEEWVDSQTLFIARSPRLPLFIISEMARNPELIKALLAEFLPPPHLLQPAATEASPEGEPGLPVLVELVGMVFSLLFFPAVAAPMIRHLLGLDSPILGELMASQARLAKELVRRRLGAATGPIARDTP